MNGFQNPYMNQFGMQQQVYQPAYPIGPQMQVTKVNGENGARSFQMGANSSALLLDENGLLVWLVTSDGAGYKTVAPYDITPHKDAPAPDYGHLETRIARLEEIINGSNTVNTVNTSANRKKPASKSDDGED